jgi:DNA-binding transcriptional MerR regulator
MTNGRLYTAEAAEKIGISKPTLIRWFAQKKIEEVNRDVRGWRVYSQADIDRITTYANKIESPKERSSEPEARRA